MLFYLLALLISNYLQLKSELCSAWPVLLSYSVSKRNSCGCKAKFVMTGAQTEEK